MRSLFAFALAGSACAPAYGRPRELSNGHMYGDGTRRRSGGAHMYMLGSKHTFQAHFSSCREGYTIQMHQVDKREWGAEAGRRLT